MHVEHFMTKNPVACDAEDPSYHVAQLMRNKGVGSVVVLNQGKVAGIVTDRQLACGPLADGDPSIPVKEVMHANPATLSLEDNVFSAVDTMRSAGVVRRIPVVNANNELLGIVSISDIAVVANDLMQAVMLEETHHALVEARVPTGAKQIVKHMRRPTKEDRLPPDQEIRAVTEPTPPGEPPSTGGAGEPPAPQPNAPSRRGSQG